jgi:predicted aspartyl protease
MKTITWKLTNHEPIIEFTVGVTSAHEAALKRAGETTPKPVKVRGLIDTGFTGGLAIDYSLVARLQLKRRDFSRIWCLRDGETKFYETTFAWDSDVAIKFLCSSQDGQNILVDPIPAVLLEFFGNQSVQALIGREVLQAAEYVFNGPKQFCSLTFSDEFTASPV